MTDSQSQFLQPVRSLSEYLQRITDITSEEQNDHSQALFYRGHADSNWKLEPAVYRIDQDGKSYRDVELQMYQEMLRRSPQAFQDCKTTFERLVKMQHYGLPTRLLDLTQSPLVALYFACCEKNESDNKCNGKVFVIKAKKENVYFQESLPFNTFSEFDFQYSLKEILQYTLLQYAYEIREFCKNAENLETDDEDYKEKMRGIKIGLLSYILVALEGNEEVLYKCIIKSISLCNSLKKEIEDMCHVKKEYSYLLIQFWSMNNKIFQNISERYHLNISDIKSALDFVNSYSEKRIIYPPLNNERIQKQQGAFICFPKYRLGETEPHFSTEQITIAGDKKTAILDELKTMGITQAYLFPELDVQANDIKNNIYPPTKNR